MERQPVHAAARRLRAGDDHNRGARGVRRPASGLDRPRRASAGGRCVIPPRRVRPRGTARLRGARPAHPGLRGRRLAARPDRPPVLHVLLDPRRPTHHPLQPPRPRVDLVDPARGRSRTVRARDRRRAAANAPARSAVARAQRVPEPHLGEPRRAQQAVLGALVRTPPGDVPVTRRSRARRLRAGDQPCGAGSDPCRRRRDDLLAAHHPPLRARAGDDRRGGLRSPTSRRSGTRG